MPRGRFVRCSAAEGFSLVELLVVMLILGILTAIGITQFGGQSAKGQDVKAKADARALYGDVQQCFVQTSDYRDCESGDPDLEPEDGLAIGTAKGEVGMLAVDQRGFDITATSMSGNAFVISQRAGGGPTHTCTVGPGSHKGACPTGTW